MSKYTQLFNNWFQRLLAYRMRIVIWMIRDVINFVIFPFIWLAIYGDRQMIAGFSKADIVTYYIIVAFVNVVITSHIGEVIKKDIVRGDLSTNLARPIHYLFYHLFHEMAYRVYGLITAIILTIIILIFLPHWLVLPHSFESMIYFTISLFLGFVISQTLQTIIGVSAFWLDENSSLNQAASLLQMLFGGEIAPLVFFSPLLQVVAAYLPFKYLIYVPAQIYLNQLTPVEIGHHFLIIITWIIILLLFLTVLWQRGIKRYDGSGI